MQFYVYILWSKSLSKTYIGYTSNLDNRVLAHNHGIKGWTVRGRPWVLAYSEIFDTKAEAMKRERFFKSGAGRVFIRKNILPNFIQ